MSVTCWPRDPGPSPHLNTPFRLVGWQISVVESIFKLQDNAPSSIVKNMRTSLIDSLA